MRRSTAALAVVVLLATNNGLPASIVNIVSHERDGSIRNSGVFTFEGYLAAGRAGGLAGQPVPDGSGILLFELPSLAPGQTILEANLQVTLLAASNLVSNEHADLYALGYVETLPPENDTNASWYYENDINDTWYYSGSLDTRNGNDLGTNIGNTPIIKIADDFATTSTPLGDVYTDALADAALVGFINGLYDEHGAQGGDYLVMRLSANQLFDQNYHRYLFYARDNTDAETWPVLSLTAVPDPSTVVPEPSSVVVWSLLGTVGITSGWWRRRRRLVWLRSEG